MHKKYSRSFLTLWLNHWCHRVRDKITDVILTMCLLPFWVLNVSVVFLSMQGQRALGLNPKYLNLCSEDEQQSCGFGTTWLPVINDRFVYFWVNYPFTPWVPVPGKLWTDQIHWMLCKLFCINVNMDQNDLFSKILLWVQLNSRIYPVQPNSGSWIVCISV